eukprot:1159016-Pelagomonas_calceolata.AAC.10
MSSKTITPGGDQALWGPGIVGKQSSWERLNAEPQVVTCHYRLAPNSRQEAHSPLPADRHVLTSVHATLRAKKRRGLVHSHVVFARNACI